MAPDCGEARDIFSNAHVLPDNGIGNGPAGRAVPDDRGFALIGDANGGKICRTEAPRGERCGDDLPGAAPDFNGIVLNPTGARVDLFVLLLRGGDDARGLVEDHEARARGSLIDGSDIKFHRARCPLHGIECRAQIRCLERRLSGKA